MAKEMQTTERRLNVNDQHIYAALRAAMVDRDRDTDHEWNNHVIVQVGPEVQFALKQEIPSGAMLISYMMLYYPGFLDRCMTQASWFVPATPWVGGELNEKMPLFSSEILVGIAIAVGQYAGFIQVGSHPITQQVIIRANTAMPFVQRTHQLINENGLIITDARDVFIELMQDEEFRPAVPVADDYIANTSWIIEEGVSMTDDGVERITVSEDTTNG